MPKRDRADLAELLLDKAEGDLAALRELLPSAVDDSILGFHAQQAVEKSLKSVLAMRGVAYERTHDLEYLMEMLDETDVEPPVPADQLAWLTQWALRFRYEAEVPELNRSQALALAERAHAWAGAVGRG